MRFYSLLSLILILPTIGLLNGCTSLNAFVLGEKVHTSRKVAEQSQGTYRIGNGDTIKINVYNELDLSGQFIVDDTGSFSLPLLGSVEATGRTIRELETFIASQLDGRFLRNPKVSGEVLTFRPFYILGQVNNPGEYQFRPSLDTVNAVAIAGGFTTRANRTVIFIKKRDESTEKLFELNSTIPVLPGDTLRVAPRYF